MMKSLPSHSVAIERPKRWDHPFDPTMLDRDLTWLMTAEPFAQMDPDVFTASMPLADILKNDSRIGRYEHGDVIIREGDYGGSAFIVLRGTVRTIVTRLDRDQQLTSKTATNTRRPSWLKLLSDSLRTWTIPEVRSVARIKNKTSSPTLESGFATDIRSFDDRPRVFLQDASAVLAGYASDPVGEGELFGEMAAITRSPSQYTVIADGPVVVLEIRWQGLRLLRRDPSFQQTLDDRYRAASLKIHLRETPLFRFLPPEHLDKIAEETDLRSFGEREWFAEYKSQRKLDAQEQIQHEPLIVSENTAVNDLILIRSGFARLSYRRGAGHRTIAYLGRGEMFGFEEIVHNSRHTHDETSRLPYQESLRALGFVDALFISRRAIVEHALPFIRESELPRPLRKPRYDQHGLVISSDLLKEIEKENQSDPALLEFLVDKRLINGRQVMLIDTDRCTRCDDCVRACARVHEGNPRFTRNGPQFESIQFAHACMHCADPVCMIGCPTGAIARDVDTGTISINPLTCIGCSVCAESCPYENIVMTPIHDATGKTLVDQKTQLPILQATKCDLCHHLPTGPACQTACPHDALVRIDVSNVANLQRWIDRP